MRRLLIALTAAALLLTSCSGGSSRPADGITYMATESTGFDLVPGSNASIQFDGGHVGLSTGCNSASGKVTWSGDTLKVGEYSITEMGCEEGLMAQEALFMDLLTGGPKATRAGDVLTLAGNLTDGTQVSVTFVEREDVPLENTHWQLDGLGTGEGQSVSFTVVPEGVSSTLSFTDTEVLVEYGCNHGGGSVAIGADTLVFGDLISTMMMCLPEAMDVEQHVTQVLHGETTYTVAGPTLTITNGSLSLQYSPAD